MSVGKTIRKSQLRAARFGRLKHLQMNINTMNMYVVVILELYFCQKLYCIVGMTNSVSSRVNICMLGNDNLLSTQNNSKTQKHTVLYLFFKQFVVTDFVKNVFRTWISARLSTATATPANIYCIIVMVASVFFRTSLYFQEKEICVTACGTRYQKIL